MSSTKTLLGFLVGAAIGGALGILFAPDKGEETRRKIADTGGDVADSLKEKFNDFVDGVKDKFANAKDEAEDVAERGFNTYSRVKSDVKAV